MLWSRQNITTRNFKDVSDDGLRLNFDFKPPVYNDFQPTLTHPEKFRKVHQYKDIAKVDVTFSIAPPYSNFTISSKSAKRLFVRDLESTLQFQIFKVLGDHNWFTLEIQQSVSGINPLAFKTMETKTRRSPNCLLVLCLDFKLGGSI